MNEEKCISYIGGNLYPLGIDGYVGQMLYLQRASGKDLTTRCIHYILSVKKYELIMEDKVNAMGIIMYVMGTYFQDYQVLLCLHNDKKDKYDIHILINPINITTLNIYH